MPPAKQKNRENGTTIHHCRTLLCLGNLRALLLRCPMEAFQRRCPVSILLPESLQRRRGNRSAIAPSAPAPGFPSQGDLSRNLHPTDSMSRFYRLLVYSITMSVSSKISSKISSTLSGSATQGIARLCQLSSSRRRAQGDARVRRECRIGSPARAGRGLWPSKPARWRRGILRRHA